MKEKEIRQIIVNDIEVRSNEDNSAQTISGYINKFNTMSQFMGFYEQVAPGAFDKTLSDGHNIFAMYNHDSNKILGSTRGGSLTLSVDNIGLKFNLEINSNISYANDVYELVKSGDIQGCSFGFFVLADEWSFTEDMADLRTITEVELIEVTITPFPAYLDSEASCRSYEKHNLEVKRSKELNELRKELEIIELENELEEFTNE